MIHFLYMEISTFVITLLRTKALIFHFLTIKSVSRTLASTKIARSVKTRNIRIRHLNCANRQDVYPAAIHRIPSV